MLGLDGTAFDTVIVGGGIAGGALATVLARAGKSVLVLERERAYRDRVRGEFFQPWGVVEAVRLGIDDVLASAGVYHTRVMPYDETIDPAEAERSPIHLDEVFPEARGTLGIGHPTACEALVQSAVAAGASLFRGVASVVVTRSSPTTVRFRWSGAERVVRCRLVVGADGRDSTVRRQLGMPLHETKPRLIGAGLLVRNIQGWPEHQVAIGTEDDRVFFVLPQSDGRARLYLMYAVTQRQRYSGPNAARAFIGDYRLACVPQSEGLTVAEPAGPCAAFPMNDSWVDSPLADSVVLIGDAAGHSDPHLGQGLSLALRDVRALSELLLGSEDWSPAALQPYADERAERGRRMRFCAHMLTTFRGEFGPEPRERRKRARTRMLAEPELGLWRRASLVGPDALPAEAFGESVREHLPGSSVV